MDLITLALAKKYTNKKFSEAISFGGFQIVEELPIKDISTSTIYLVKASGSNPEDAYNEYVYIADSWELIGTTAQIHDV